MATLADDLIGNLLNAGGLIGKSFAEGRQNNLVEQQGQQQLQMGKMQIAAAQTAQAKQQQYQSDVADYSANPTPQLLSQLMVKYPDQAAAIKSSYDVLDAPAKESRLGAVSDLYFAASNNRPDLAAARIGDLVQAEKKAGLDTSEAEQLQAELQATDPVQKQAALTHLKAWSQAHLAIADPKSAEMILGKKESYTLNPGDVRFEDGKEVARSPYLKGPNDEILERDGTGGGGQTSGGAAGAVGMSPAAASVATTLASSGLPAPVVAGFMGNFHVEGGYDGAQGDGGSASGIGQWHAPRASNFQKVIGKPVTEATPAEQAKFVAWEMQNPQAAGMTVKQRDAILAAKTPAQAAALIDQFYERSSGRDRKVRMDAATAFAGDSTRGAQTASADGAPSGYHVVVPGKQKDAPSGFQWAPDGKTLQPIPGGPQDGGNDEMSDAAVNNAAQVYNMTGQLPPSLGRGGKVQQRILSRAAELAGGTDVGSLVADRASRKADTAALATLQRNSAQILPFEATALRNGALALRLGAKVGNGNVPIFNSWVNGGRKATGDGDVTAFNAAIETFANEYAKVVSGATGGAVTSDTARQHASDLINKSMSPDQLSKTMTTLAADMANRRRGLLDERDNLLKRIHGPIAGAPAPTSGWGKAVRVK